MIDIIIPVYNQTRLTLACLVSIRRFTDDYRLIIVDNASEEMAYALVKDELRFHPHVVIRNNQNLGFVKATNQGIALSKAPYVVFLNNDTEVTFDWVDKLQQPFRANPLIGAVGPITTSPNCWQGKAKFDIGFKLLHTKSMLAFFCVMLKREVIENVGYLDEDFGVGLADDDDYCHRIHQAGYRLALAHNLKITHHHRSTFGELYSKDEIKQLTQQGLNLFYSKHPEAK